MMSISEIQKLEEQFEYFEAFDKLYLLHKKNPTNLDIFLRTIFLNWFCLTLLTSRPKEEEDKLLASLPELTKYGLKYFINEPDFLILMSNLCSRFFFYLFGVTEKFGENICNDFIQKFPSHPIAELFALQENLTEDLKKKIISKRSELNEFVNKKYQGQNIYDAYFRDAFTNIAMY